MTIRFEFNTFEKSLQIYTNRDENDKFNIKFQKVIDGKEETIRCSNCYGNNEEQNMEIYKLFECSDMMMSYFRRTPKFSSSNSYGWYTTYFKEMIWPRNCHYCHSRSHRNKKAISQILSFLESHEAKDIIAMIDLNQVNPEMSAIMLKQLENNTLMSQLIENNNSNNIELTKILLKLNNDIDVKQNKLNSQIKDNEDIVSEFKSLFCNVEKVKSLASGVS